MSRDKKISLYALDRPALDVLVEGLGHKRFRAKQIWGFLYDKGVSCIADMHNLPKSLIEQLSKTHCVFDMKVATVQESADKSTRKYLLTLHDNHQIECVRMQYRHGYSLCISSQVGCAMGCSFCASTIDGLARHLDAYEYWQQIALVNYTESIRIGNVVLMGSGEPLHNYEPTLAFIRTVSADQHLNIGQRHITLSTCGMVEAINRLASEKLQITLAVSLHSPFDADRSEIVPINRQFGLTALLMAINNYIALTGRRVSIEYALIAGVNDDLNHAKALIKLFKGKLVHINLIPINTVKERAYRPSAQNAVVSFQRELQNGKLNATIRRELGDDIDAACGQLRRNFIDIDKID